MSTLLVLIIVTALIMCCDVSDLTLSEQDMKLFYVSDDYQETEPDKSEDKIFGDSTITQEINTDDLVDFDAAAQAEEALNRIYNGGK